MPRSRRCAPIASVTLARQPDGDLGARMLAALKASGGPTLVIGTDCPAMMPAHLRKAADVLRGGADAVVYPAEDGGYVLIGMRKPLPALFAGMRWSTADVMEETRRRLQLSPAHLAGAGHAVGRGRAGGSAAAARARPAGRVLAVSTCLASSGSAGSAPARRRSSARRRRAASAAAPSGTRPRGSCRTARWSRAARRPARSAPPSSPRSRCRRTPPASRRRRAPSFQWRAISAKIARPAPRQRIERHHDADADEHRGGIGMARCRRRARRRRRPAYRRRSSPRSAAQTDGAPVEVRQIAAAAQREQQHAGGQHGDADPAQRARAAPRAAPPPPIAVISGAEPRASG